ncbi:hypothetical protein ACVWYJ_005763 [Bradyrhizobium sp. USDA 4471]
MVKKVMVRLDGTRADPRALVWGETLLGYQAFSPDARNQ